MENSSLSLSNFSCGMIHVHATMEIEDENKEEEEAFYYFTIFFHVNSFFSTYFFSLSSCSSIVINKKYFNEFIYGMNLISNLQMIKENIIR